MIEEGPINVSPLEPMPKRLASRHEQDVVAKHVLRDFEANQPGVDHQGDFLEKPNEIAPLLHGGTRNARIARLEEVQNLTVLRRFQKAAPHLHEIFSSPLTALA